MPICEEKKKEAGEDRYRRKKEEAEEKQKEEKEGEKDLQGKSTLSQKEGGRQDCCFWGGMAGMGLWRMLDGG